MGTISKAVQSNEYRKALELTALKLAEILDGGLDEKNAAQISREFRLIMERLGLDDKTNEDFVGDAQKSVSDKL